LRSQRSSPETVEITKLIKNIVEIKETVVVFSEATFTPVPTYTTIPTYTPLPTLAPVLITATFTPVSDLREDRTAGLYLVNVDISPGIWRNDGLADNCYWSITDQTGDIIDNQFGMSGGIMNIPPNAYQVELHEEC